MLIYTDFEKPIILESLDDPIVADYFWLFSGPLMDFKPSPLIQLEETTGPTLVLEIEGSRIKVPASWNILICDRETAGIDCMPLINCTRNTFQAFLMSSKDVKFRSASIKIVDVIKEDSCVHPVVPKSTMMCHPVGLAPKVRFDEPENVLSVMIGPHDLYAKWLSGAVVGDILYA
ncbi:hypothetical protein RsoM2USA_231 [Ralstonia phage RsoM2USA]|nr:hypothetical protein RsoM2USA_231 [Ralstonia phage RsoM2USA]